MALRYLARREYAAGELTERLRRRGARPGDAEAVVAELVEQGLVSDRRFAEAFVRSRVQRLYGPLRIRAELRARGVGDDTVEALLGALADDWQEHALAWCRKGLEGALDHDMRVRLYRRGSRRGFTHEQLMRALDRLAGEGQR
ncbi:MAG: hypothetical protein GTO58_18480 [Hydrogenophaga sp.]|nr:hypothetical protein [Hydrogenophaga sp.]